MAVGVQVDVGGVKVDPPQSLFTASDVQSPLLSPFGEALYTPAGDGERFLVVRRPVEGTPTVNAMLNWSQARDQR